jgi:hypothetical protein
MWAIRSTPHRGLVAGLVALVGFASGAVAMTASGSSSATTAATQAQSVQTFDAVEVHHDGGHHR